MSQREHARVRSGFQKRSMRRVSQGERGLPRGTEGSSSREAAERSAPNLKDFKDMHGEPKG